MRASRSRDGRARSRGGNRNPGLKLALPEPPRRAASREQEQGQGRRGRRGGPRSQLSRLALLALLVGTGTAGWVAVREAASSAPPDAPTARVAAQPVPSPDPASGAGGGLSPGATSSTGVTPTATTPAGATSRGATASTGLSGSDERVRPRPEASPRPGATGRPTARPPSGGTGHDATDSPTLTAHPPGLDPRFGNCQEARSAGYGPYDELEDPEYAWYPDPDADGLACE